MPNRREFLKKSGVAGLFVGVGGCVDPLDDREETSSRELDLDLQENNVFTATTRGQEGYFFPSGVEWSQTSESGFVVVDKRVGSISTFDKGANRIKLIDRGATSDGFYGLLFDEIENKWYATTDGFDTLMMTVFDESWNMRRQITYRENEISLRGGLIESNSGNLYSFDRALFELDDSLEVVGIAQEFSQSVGRVGGLYQLDDDSWLMLEAGYTPDDNPPTIHLVTEEWEIESSTRLKHINPAGGLLVDEKELFVFHEFWGSSDVQNASISTYEYEIVD